MQLRISVLAKSTHPGRQTENADLFGFHLDEEDMAALAELDRGEGAARDSDIEEEY